MKKKVVILGAGISGLSVALRLLEGGYEVEILEKNPYIGGLAATVQRGSYALDIGPHFIECEFPEIFDFIEGLFDYPLPIIEGVITKIYINNRFIDFPFTPRGLLFNLGFKSSVSIALSYARTLIRFSIGKTQEKESQTIKDWAISNFGNYLYELFFKPYTETFWKRPVETLSSAALPTSRKITFLNTLKMLFVKKSNSSGKKELNLVERGHLTYYYPHSGFGEVSARIATRIKDLGGIINTDVRLTSVMQDRDGKYRVRYKAGSDSSEAVTDLLASTIPIGDLANLISDLPESVTRSSSAINYVALIAIYFVTKKRVILNSHLSYWLGRPYHRLSETNKFSEKTSPGDDNMLCAEITCYKDDATWCMSDDQLFDLCLPFIENDHILNREDIIDCHVLKIGEAYPVRDLAFKENSERVSFFLKDKFNIHSIGRLGAFTYGSIDSDIKRGFETANAMIQETKYNKP